ncbi:hypothetical protein EPA93_38930 [Ktedonosporobacter rubrisoli]|uniref:2'-5' RNA ligase family protein n=1 Tax=Ktedonosporobacter rubrisoli TaxID=2509675 RepID=A0A4P6K0B6_KTERU|nr:hypothetical protein [Ktedonosporobacter rubrisoli]QBD81628.1 hypothetical protein EPA93_38930 [Ktedonosporobacter rubrisoli]
MLYIPVVRTGELSCFHQELWSAISCAAQEIMPYYEPEIWVPHITLAEHDIEAEKLSRLMARLFTRELHWKITIDNLALIQDTGTQQVLGSQVYFQQP